VANGVHKSGDNGMLFEEWCDEHSYLRRAKGCNGSSSAVACDMAILQQFSSDPMNVALVHIPDGGVNHLGGSGGSSSSGGGGSGVEAQRGQQIAMSESGVLKLAAFLWVRKRYPLRYDQRALPLYCSDSYDNSTVHISRYSIDDHDRSHCTD
jgi:hypothetical protein